MNRVMVKVCGIKKLEDALAAVEAGVDMLGFNFYPSSPRYISPLDCAHLQAALDNRGLSIDAVGVFVNIPSEEIRSILSDCHLSLAQLSGDEQLADLQELKTHSYKAIRPRNMAEAIDQGYFYAQRASTPALLIDACHPGQYGGTGQTGDWSLAQALAMQYPVLLAGGLTPQNVTSALKQVRPWGVDVASGVESAPGGKDPEKMAAFVRAVREFTQEN